MTSPETHSLETICKLLDLSPRRVQQLSKEGVIPKAERGQYELLPAVRGYIRYLKERSINPGVVSFDEVRARKTAAEAELVEIELKEKRGNLISVDDVVATWVELIGACKSRMLSMPAKLAPVVAVEDNPSICKQIIEDQVLEALQELSGWIDEHAFAADTEADDDSSGSVEAAADADSESMG